MKIKHFLLTHFCTALFVLTATALTATQSRANNAVIRQTPQLPMLYPSPQQSRTSLAILTRLSQMHYNKISIDDTLSEQLYNNYLNELDSSKSYFTQEDIKEFSRYRKEFDEALKAGNLRPAFDIFNRYNARTLERLRYFDQTISTGLSHLNLDDDEKLVVDRKNLGWPQNTQSAQDLWRQQLENSVIDLKLAGKNIDEIAELLEKRFKSQQDQTLQINSDDAFQIYIDALTKVYDPHTQYFSPRSSKDFDIHMSLSLEGIGAVLQKEDEFIKVVRLVPAGPADKSKQISPTDKIVGVGQGKNGEIIDVIGWRLDDVVQLIRGPKESIVRLEVITGKTESTNERKIIEIIRNTVELEEQAAKKDIMTINKNGKDFKIGIINLPTFYYDFKGAEQNKKSVKSSTQDVKRLITELQAEGIDGLVMDLRNNGGGSLQEANALTGLFIKNGPTVQIKASNGSIDILQDDDNALFYKGPLVVLVNRMSASASEIFAGAIQDYHRGLIIGNQTFGKGTVQSLLPLQNQAQLKLTLAKFYRVSGESNQNKGIIPDISYPSMYDEKEIGESALVNALPWDYISPVEHSVWDNYQKITPDLIKLHEVRIQNNPDFIHLNQQLAYYNTIRSIKSVSLSEKARKNEKDQQEKNLLLIENQKRKAKGMEAIAKIDKKLEAANDNSNSESKSLLQEDDGFLLVEAGNILLDFREKLTAQSQVASH